MRGTLFTLMWVACAAASAATTVYKWVDESGVTHYSDQPHENAAKVELREPQTFPATHPPAGASNDGAPTFSESSAPEGPKYASCAFSSPTAEQVFLNTFTVNAALSLQPGQRPGDHIVITLDGHPVPGLNPFSQSFTLQQVERGSHSLQAVIQDSAGKAVCQSSVTFYVRQPSQQGPNTVIRPRS